LRKHRFSPPVRRGYGLRARAEGLGLIPRPCARDLAAPRLSVQPLLRPLGLRWENGRDPMLRKLPARPSSKRPVFPERSSMFPMADLYGRHWSTGGRGTPGFRAGDESVYLREGTSPSSRRPPPICAMRGIPTLALGRAQLESFPRRDAGVLPRPREALGPRLGRIHPDRDSLSRPGQETKVILRGRRPASRPHSVPAPGRKTDDTAACAPSAPRGLHAFLRAGFS